MPVGVGVPVGDFIFFKLEIGQGHAHAHGHVGNGNSRQGILRLPYGEEFLNHFRGRALKSTLKWSLELIATAKLLNSN